MAKKNSIFLGLILWQLLTEGVCLQHPVSCNAEYNYKVPFGEPKEYYLICRFRGVYVEQPSERAGFQYDIRHDIWDEPFTKRNCKELGCDPVVWKDSPKNEILLNLMWTDPVRYAITAPQLRLCVVPDGDQVKSSSLKQFINVTDDLCTGMKDYSDVEATPGFWKKSIQQSYVGPRADQFMHVSSNILNKEETAELNSVGRVTTTVDKDCSYIRGGCSFVITTPQAPCAVTVDGEHIPTRETVDKYGLGKVWYGNKAALQSGNYGNRRPEDDVTEYYGLYPATVHHVTVQHNLFTFITDDQTNKTYTDYRPVLFELICWLIVFDNSTRLEPASRSKVKKKIILKTNMWPSISVLDALGADRYGNHFYFWPDVEEEAHIHVLVVGLNEVTFLTVTRIDQPLIGREVLVQKLFYNPVNRTTTYRMKFPKLNEYKNATFFIEAEIFQLSSMLSVNTLIHITKLKDINMRVSPMQVAALRGDQNSVSFLCMATGYPTPNITWSGITSLREAEQIPVSTSEKWLPKGYTAVYLQFPSSDNLTREYSGEYTCTVTSYFMRTALSGTAFITVFEPGSIFEIFRSLSNTAGQNTIEILDNETRATEENTTSSTMTLMEQALEEKRILAVLVVSVLVVVLIIVSMVIWVLVLIQNCCKKKKQKVTLRTADMSSDENSSDDFSF